MLGSLLLCACILSAEAEGRYFRIQVVDEATGRGVPLVELRTVHDVTYVTDSHGNVAFYEPGLMDMDVFFTVSSHGYEFPKDGFGFRGQRLRTTRGGSAELKIRRLNIAERLYRVTGGGIYADSLLTGQPVPIQQPVINGLVLGQDSVVNAVYRGQIYWFWGDTNRPSYPLGNFHAPGATSQLPDRGGLDPNRGVDLHYFVDDRGFAKPAAEMPGQGPTWINGLVTLNDASGRERLFCTYAKIADGMKTYERGLAVFNDEKQAFDKDVVFDLKAPLHPGGHPGKYTDASAEYVYFADPYPFTRVRATIEDLKSLAAYETYTCFTDGSHRDKYELDRDADGKLRYAWRKNTMRVTRELQQVLIQNKRMKADEALIDMRDAESGKAVNVHGASVYWNAYRNRWVMIALEAWGTSLLGEIWFAEADSLVGPWRQARKIVTHDKYSFYNPKQHPMFDQDGGRTIFFEATYTTTFSGNEHPTPRYNYNQIMYKLDLADPRLKLPARAESAN